MANRKLIPLIYTMVLVDWYLVIRLPENLLIEAIQTSNTSLNMALFTFI